jgi:hypothetical protein
VCLPRYSEVGKIATPGVFSSHVMSTLYLTGGMSYAPLARAKTHIKIHTKYQYFNQLPNSKIIHTAFIFSLSLISTRGLYRFYQKKTAYFQPLISKNMAQYVLPQFDLSQENDGEIVRSFLVSLEHFFTNFVEAPFNFSDWVGQKNIGGLTSGVFQFAWEETSNAFQKTLNLFDANRAEGTLYRKLESIGFTKHSLRAKAILLNAFSNKLREFIVEFFPGDAPNTRIFSILFSPEKSSFSASMAFINILKDLLDYLNALLGSLAKIFEVIDIIKEFKELIEGTIEV